VTPRTRLILIAVVLLPVVNTATFWDVTQSGGSHGHGVLNVLAVVTSELLLLVAAALWMRVRPALVLAPIAWLLGLAETVVVLLATIYVGLSICGLDNAGCA
jgi:hypothetical protein